jgi:hypothetical protein
MHKVGAEIETRIADCCTNAPAHSASVGHMGMGETSEAGRGVA